MDRVRFTVISGLMSVVLDDGQVQNSSDEDKPEETLGMVAIVDL